MSNQEVNATVAKEIKPRIKEVDALG